MGKKSNCVHNYTECWCMLMYVILMLYVEILNNHENRYHERIIYKKKTSLPIIYEDHNWFEYFLFKNDVTYLIKAIKVYGLEPRRI